MRDVRAVQDAEVRAVLRLPGDEGSGRGGEGALHTQGEENKKGGGEGGWRREGRGGVGSRSESPLGLGWQ